MAQAGCIQKMITHRIIPSIHQIHQIHQAPTDTAVTPQSPIIFFHPVMLAQGVILHSGNIARTARQVTSDVYSKQETKTMSIHSFCRDCEHKITRMVPGIHSPIVEEVSCPARFNPMEGKWNPEQGVNPYECPRNQQFIQLLQRQNTRSSRRTY
jgi:hypothetical protein